MRLVNLQNVTIVRATPLKAPSPPTAGRGRLRCAHSIIPCSSPEPAARGRQRVAALAFDVGDSDLPLRVAFPLLMTNALHWLAGDTSETTAGVIAGEQISLPPGATISHRGVDEPPVMRDPAKTTIGFLQPLHDGFHLVTDNGATSWVAVNTFSEAESDLRGDATSARRAPAAFRWRSLAGFRGWPMWQYLALAALIPVLAASGGSFTGGERSERGSNSRTRGFSFLLAASCCSRSAQRRSLADFAPAQRTVCTTPRVCSCCSSPRAGRAACCCCRRARSR